MGFWSYDVIRTIERIPSQAADDLGLPDYLFLRMDELWIIDHEENTLYCVRHSFITGWVFGGASFSLNMKKQARRQKDVRTLVRAESRIIGDSVR